MKNFCAWVALAVASAVFCPAPDSGYRPGRGAAPGCLVVVAVRLQPIESLPSANPLRPVFGLPFRNPEAGRPADGNRLPVALPNAVMFHRNYVWQPVTPNMHPYQITLI